MKIDIYDFDLTLFRSPEPPDWWNKKEHGSWTSTYHSLGMPFVPTRAPSSYWIKNVVRSAKQSISDFDTWTILCTGRIDRISLRYRIAELLKQESLNFDEVFLNNLGSKTPFFKKWVTYQTLKKYPFVTKVQMWEDTQENLDEVEALCLKLGVEFKGRLVTKNPHPLPQIKKSDYETFMSK